MSVNLLSIIFLPLKLSRRAVFPLLIAAAVFWLVPATEPRADSFDEEHRIAEALADVLRAGRSVISGNQERINSETPVDKGFTGDVVVGLVEDLFRERTGVAWDDIDKSGRQYRYLSAEIESIREVLDENQGTINKPDVGFKGFVPAVFGRLVTERFREKVGQEVDMKVTAPPALVRNRKARPDAFEKMIIKDHLSADDWPQGDIYTAQVESESGDTIRLLVPEYYKPACMSCHGEPKGEIDVTGYPKEGAKVGDLGGVISFQFF